LVIVLGPIARIAVGVLLLWAAAAKLRRREDLPDWLAAYGVPRRATVALVIVLLSAETAVGALLLADVPGAPYAALLLGAVFVTAVTQARLRGVTRLRCGCFGGGIRRTTSVLVRALGFTALAGLAAFGGTDVGAPSRDAVFFTVLGLLAAAVVGLAVLVFALYRQVGVLMLRLGPRVALELAEEGPPVGDSAPALERLGRRGSELVVFFSPDCRLCRRLAPGVAALAREGLPVRVVDEAEEAPAFERWNVPGTPFAVHVVDGRVAAKGTVNALEEVDGLLATGTRRVGAAA
jgi:methylamine utilization protein MauE